MKYNILQDKSYKFAIRIIRMYQFLAREQKEYILSKQVLRSGTSIGANVEEAIGAQTDKDFFMKLSVAYKEARETHYWLRLLRDTDYIPEDAAASILNEADELLKIIGTIRKKLEAKRTTLNS